MTNYLQNIFNMFSCIADKCDYNCCENWQVSIDANTRKKLCELNGYLEQKVKENIVKEGTDLIFKNSEKRCPFLNNNNLCEIITDSDEKYIPKTCKIFPRFIRAYGSRKEFGLSLSCPEATRLFLENNFSIIIEEDEIPPEIWDADAKKFIKLYSQRTAMLSAKSVEIKPYDLNILKKCEYISGYIPQLIENTNIKINTIDQNILLKIFKYYTFKYYLDSLEENDMTEFILFNTFAIKSLIESSSDSPQKIITHYSREIEHSEKNIKLIKKYLSH